jgi:uncharacterized membrane protein
LGIALVLRMIPTEVLEECRERARSELAGARPVSRAAAAVIIVLWILGAVFTMWLVYRAWT